MFAICLHGSKLRATCGAGDPVIQLITMLPSSLVVHPCPWLALGVSGEFTKLRRHMAACQFARRVCCLSVFSHGGSCADHISPLLLRNMDFGVSTVELTNKLFDDAGQLIRNVPARPKCCKGIYELLFTEEDFQSFQLSLTCKCAYCVTASPWM